MRARHWLGNQRISCPSARWPACWLSAILARTGSTASTEGRRRPRALHDAAAAAAEYRRASRSENARRASRWRSRVSQTGVWCRAGRHCHVARDGRTFLALEARSEVAVTPCACASGDPLPAPARRLPAAAPFAQGPRRMPVADCCQIGTNPLDAASIALVVKRWTGLAGLNSAAFTQDIHIARLEQFSGHASEEPGGVCRARRTGAKSSAKGSPVACAYAGGVLRPIHRRHPLPAGSAG
jgi:hypothetical protein